MLSSRAMSVRAATLEHEPSDHDGIVVLHGVSWAQYETILGIRGDRSVPRVCYLAGELELMSPSRNHERIKAMFGRLLWVWAEERGVALNAYGSWTLKSEPDARGAEPDDCYVVGDRDAEVPDLAIEVVWTSGGLDKLAVYAPLGVREVWTWSEGRLAVHVLRAGRYVAATRSEVLPGIDLALLLRFVDRTDQTAAARAYRDALRAATGG